MREMLFCKDTEHTKIYRLITLLFVVSLGMGEVIAVKGIKLSYLLFFLMVICFLGKDRGKIVLKKNKVKLYILIAMLIIWMVYPVIQLLWTKDLGLWLSFYRALLINLMVTILLLNYIDSWGDWIWISRAFVVLQIIMILVGYFEIATGHHFVLLEGELNAVAYAHKPISFYGNGNDNATILFFCLCNSLVYFFVEKRKIIKQALLLLLSAATVHQILIIDARGATYSLFLLIPFVLYFCAAIKLRRSGVTNERRFEVLTIAIAAVAVTAIFAAHPLQYYFALFSGSGNYGSDVGRIAIIQNGFKAFLDSFLLGTGPGQSILASGINLHFFYLEMLFEYGLFFGGFMLLAIFMSAFCKRSGFPMMAESILRSMPFVLVLTGVSSSKTFIMRPTWIFLTLILASLYIEPADQDKNHS